MEPETIIKYTVKCDDVILINDILNLIIFVVSLIITAVSLNYYRKTRIKEYLIFGAFVFSTVLFSISVNLHLFLEGIYFENNINVTPTENISYNILLIGSSLIPPLNHYILVEFWNRAIRSRTSKRITWFMRSIMVLTGLLYLPLIQGNVFYLLIAFEHLKLLRAITYFLAVLGMGIMYIELRKKLKGSQFITKKPEIYQFYRYWRLNIWIVFLFVSAWAVKIGYNSYQYISGVPITVIDNFYTACLLLASLAYLVVCYIAVFHPQGLLLFEYQIIQALKMYSKIQPSEKEIASMGIAQISKYLELVRAKLDGTYWE